MEPCIHRFVRRGLSPLGEQGHAVLTLAYSFVFAFCLPWTYRLCAAPTNTVSTPTKRPENQLPEACELYNAALQEGLDAWKVCRKSIHCYDQAEQLKPLREEGLLGLANFSCCQM